MMAILGARWLQLISRTILGLAFRKLIAWVTCGVYIMTMKTSCILALVMKSFNVMSAHIFQLWVIWHYLHMLPPLHASFVILRPYVWWMVLDELIMLCINYQQSLERLFILGSTSILWWMASVGSQWMKLEGWSHRKLIARIMWRYLRFCWVLARPSQLRICLMIVVMALWNF
jgi:hypothetical protein